jgi:hypothetical protein
MPLDALLPSPPGAGTMQRVGTLVARTWRAKLYAPALAAGGLRPEDLAAAERAYRAGIAGPVAAPTAGFALLRPGCGDGGLVFSAYWWAGAELHRTTLLLPGCGGSPRRWPDAAGQVGDVGEVLLMAREAAAWCRCVLDADRPSLDAYSAECCA